MSRRRQPRLDVDRAAGSWPLVLGVAAAVLFSIGWPLAMHPLWTAPSRDPAWYTWRANVILEADPGRLASDWSPPGVFAGGYRISTPLTGALLERVAHVDPFAYTAMLFVAIPVLTGLFLAVGAHRGAMPGVVAPATVLASGAIFLTTPYVGYLDDGMAIMLLALAFPFAARANASIGARVALLSIGALVMLTHPTTCALFVLSLLGMVAGHLMTSRFDLRETIRRDGWLVASFGAGSAIGVAMWWLGVWGPGAPLTRAAIAPPYGEDIFRYRLFVWLATLHLPLLVPAILVALAWTIVRARRERRPAGAYELLSLWWLLPIVGALGFLVQRGAGPAQAAPYYRFINGTGGPIAATGLGAGAVIAWLLSRRGAARAGGALGTLVIVAALVSMLISGRAVEGPQRWATGEVRVALAAVHELVARAGERPIVLVMDHGRGKATEVNRAYGWAKSATNAFRIGLPGGADARSATYVGLIDRFVEDVPTTGASAAYDQVARRFFGSVQAVRRAEPEEPLAFVWSEYYPGKIDPERVSELTPGMHVVDGPGLYAPSTDELAAARKAAAAVRARIEQQPGAFAEPGHLLAVLGGLALLLVLPGALAAPFFEIRDGVERIALVPGVSMLLTLSTAVVVLGLWRGPLTGTKAGCVIVLASVTGLAMRLARRFRAAAGSGGRHGRVME